MGSPGSRSLLYSNGDVRNKVNTLLNTPQSPQNNQQNVSTINDTIRFDDIGKGYFRSVFGPSSNSKTLKNNNNNNYSTDLTLVSPTHSAKKVRHRFFER